jgi:hypothetical protein
MKARALNIFFEPPHELLLQRTCSDPRLRSPPIGTSRWPDVFVCFFITPLEPNNGQIRLSYLNIHLKVVSYWSVYWTLPQCNHSIFFFRAGRCLIVYEHAVSVAHACFLNVLVVHCFQRSRWNKWNGMLQQVEQGSNEVKR